MNWTIRKEECRDALRAIASARSLKAAKRGALWLLYAALVGPTFWASETLCADDDRGAA